SLCSDLLLYTTYSSIFPYTTLFRSSFSVWVKSPNTGLKSIPHACQYNCSPIMPNRFFKEVSGYSAICPRVVMPIRYKFLSILEPMPQIFLPGKGTALFLHLHIYIQQSRLKLFWRANP